VSPGIQRVGQAQLERLAQRDFGVPLGMHPETRTSLPPLGGARGDWRYRLLRFHLPLALASAGVILLWLSVPLFQAAGHQSPPESASHTGAHPASSGADHAGDHRSPRTGSQTAGHQGPGQAGGENPATTHPATQPAIVDDRVFIARFTTASGYVALGWLALTLLIGPANLLLDRRNPVSSYLRRDIGAWTAIVSLIHVIAGFFVHGPAAPFGERVRFYFSTPDGRLLTNSFGLGNWSGLAATLIAVGLLAISSNFALAKLKAGPWKWLQRLNYALFLLVILHAIYYGALSRVTTPTTILLGLFAGAVFAGQMLGVWLWRRKRARTTARPPA